MTSATLHHSDNTTSTILDNDNTQALLLRTKYYLFLLELAHSPATVTITVSVVPVMTKLLKRLGG